MNKIYGIIGALCFAIAVALGYFVHFPADTLVEVAVAAFGLAFVIAGAVKKAVEEDSFTWKTVTCIALAIVGGVLCCVGGFTQNIFATVSGAVLSLITIIFGVLLTKKE